MEGAAPFGCW